jgi:hypothetical protein
MTRLQLVPLYLMTAVAMSGCGGTITGALGQAPGALSQIEQIKTELVVAPIAGCVSMIQGVAGQVKTLETGVPGIPVTPALPPSPVTPTPPAPPPVTTLPPPAPGGGPVVTPSARYRHRAQSIGRTVPDITHADFGWDKWGRPVVVSAE